MSLPKTIRPKPDPIPIPNDPTQRIDEFITRMRYFKEVRKILRLLDPGILAYCWADTAPDDDGPYIHPPMVRDSLGVFSFPGHRNTIGGTLVVVHKNFLNDGVNSGNHSIIIQPAAGCPIELMWCTIKNADTSSRTCTAHISSAGGALVRTLFTSSLGAGAYDHYPDPATPTHGPGLPLNDELRVQTDALAVAVSQDSQHCIVYRYFGATAPTITTSEPTGCTVSDVA